MIKTLGIVGGGQLGRMLAQAAQKLGLRVIVLDPTPNSPAGQVADQQIVGDFKDAAAIRQLAGLADVLTFEIESANAAALTELVSAGSVIHPSPDTLGIIKDKLKQKEFLEATGLPVAAFAPVATAHDIKQIAEIFDYPIMLKARFDAYDGRGNALIRDQFGIDTALEKLDGRSLYVEKFVPFVKELSVVVARAGSGEIKTFPVVETIHKDNICHTVIAPANVTEEVREQAEALAKRVLEVLAGVGVFGIEMFLTADNHVLINEIAPRVHNSGHHTIEATATSQFEQHVRAVTGLPLGDSHLTSPAAVMVNILGDRSGNAEAKGLAEAQSLGDVFVHVYGKMETRPQRKMGHITVIGTDPIEVLAKAEQARKFISI